MPNKSLEDLVEEQGYDDETKSHVLADIDKQKTRERIEAGELRLPNPVDAKRSQQIAAGTFGKSETELKQADKIKDLESRLSALEGGNPDNGSSGLSV
jgi:hypothetical protein